MDAIPFGDIAEFIERRLAHQVVQIKDDKTGESTGVLLTQGEAGTSITDLEPYLAILRDTPRHRTGTAVLHSIAALIAHANRFKEGRSALFCNLAKPSLTAIYDYHDEVNVSPNSAGSESPLPRFLKHRAVYEFPLSKEWVAWKKQDGQPMSQREFAAFLEDRIMEVIEAPPDNADVQAMTALLGGSFATPSDLISLSRSLKITATETAMTVVNLSSGEGQINYDVSHATSQASAAQVKVPNAFLLLIPVFEMDAAYYVAARLRYRLEEGKIRWHYNLFKPEKRFDHALDGACKQVTEATGLPLFAGIPEA